jgi:hypothetical protein
MNLNFHFPNATVITYVLHPNNNMELLPSFSAMGAGPAHQFVVVKPIFLKKLLDTSIQ